MWKIFFINGEIKTYNQREFKFLEEKKRHTAGKEKKAFIFIQRPKKSLCKDYFYLKKDLWRLPDKLFSLKYS